MTKVIEAKRLFKENRSIVVSLNQANFEFVPGQFYAVTIVRLSLAAKQALIVRNAYQHMTYLTGEIAGTTAVRKVLLKHQGLLSRLVRVTLKCRSLSVTVNVEGIFKCVQSTYDIWVQPRPPSFPL